MNSTSDWKANYWKREAAENGFMKAADIDHNIPDYNVVIYLMERSGEL